MQNLLMFLSEIGEHERFGLNAGAAACGMIHVRDVAAVAVECLASDAHIGRDYALTGPAAITFADVAAALSSSMGSTVTYIAMADGDFRRQLLGHGQSEDTAAALTETYKGVSEGRFAGVTDAVREITGRAATPVSQFASELAISIQRLPRARPAYARQSN